MTAKPVRVLLIDDEEIIRLTIMQFFRSEGYECIAAANGREGLECVAQYHPDIVFVDLRLPDVSGLAVLEQTVMMDAETPVIMISGAGGIDDAMEAMRHGAWDYIVKPFASLETLLHAATKAFERKALLRENRIYHEHLEQMVSQRTAELQQANERLSAEIEQRKAAEAALQSAYDGMEEQVRQRTADLKLANEQLEREIKERSTMQDALIRSERLAAVGTLAGGVAHEFNNINVTVLGFSELLLQRQDLDNDIRSALERIKNGALRAKKITTSLLTFSDIRKPQAFSFSLKDTVEEVVQIIGQQFRSMGIRFDMDLTEVQPCRMDKSQISQVVMNFLTNARDAVHHRDDKRIALRVFESEGKVAVSVSDNGCGIPEKYVTNLFTPFFSTKGEHSLRHGPMSDLKGVGLGLSVSHTIATNHGGEIRVESREGQGSTFTLWLPVAPVAVNAQGPLRRVGGASFTGRREATVLIIDDEPDTLDLVRTALERKGHSVIATDDGEEAFAFLRDNRVDLVLVDLQMPKMPGRLFIQKLQELPPINRPHVTVITGRTYDTEVEAYTDTFDLDIMQKPFTLADLNRQVEKVMDSRAATI